MSPELTDVLRPFGWYPGRRHVTAEWLKALSADGFALIPEAERILATFGGITLRVAVPARAAFQPPVVHFDPTRPGGHSDVTRLFEWQSHLGFRMNPIADLDYGHATLALGEDGGVYSCFEVWLYRYGESFTDALENTLLRGNRVPEIVGDMRPCP